MPRVTRTAGQPDAPTVAIRPYLFLVLEAHRPTATGAAIPLRRGALTIGGGERTGASGDRIDVVDPYASTTHARLVPVLDRWQVEDAGSKNGTFVNGKSVRSQVLADRDVVEVGRSFFMFRAAVDEPAVSDPGGDGTDAFRTHLPALRARFATLARIARSKVPVVLLGETGTGKEVVTAAIHRLSARSGPLVAFNCGALAAGLVPSELFGHRQGAFSGATEDRPGLVRSADTGTLFLDEVAELSAEAQVALLRVLEQGEVLAVGATRPQPVDVRVLAASPRDLRDGVEAGRFRDDLYNRLAGFTFTLPPLRQRREDFAIFVAAMLGRLGAGDRTFTPAAARALLGHTWPGNLRQLWKCLEAAVVVAGDAPIAPEHLGLDAAAAVAPATLDADDARQRDELEALLRTHEGNIAAVGRELGKAPGQIRRWLKRYGLDPERFRK